MLGILNNISISNLVQRQHRMKVCISAIPSLLYGGDISQWMKGVQWDYIQQRWQSWEAEQDKVYQITDNNENILEELKVDPIEKNLAQYNIKIVISCQHNGWYLLDTRNNYRPTERWRPGLPLNRQLDGWVIYWCNFATSSANSDVLSCLSSDQFHLAQGTYGICEVMVAC
jgi:hypothetical protein